MTTTRLRLASLSLLACTALAATGCGGQEDSTVDLGSGVVTPGAASTEEAPSAGATQTDATPSSTSSDATPGSAASPSDTSGAPAVPAPFRDDEAELEAENQTGDGRTVRVQEVQLSRTDGFAAVYTRDRERLLGFAKVARSTREDQGVTVRLDKPLTSTTQLLVVLHADDGDGRFDPEKDPRVNGDDDDVELEVDRITYRVR